MDQLTLTPQERALLDATAVPLADARRLQLADFVLAEIHEPPKRSRRRTLGILSAIVAVLTLSGGVAYAWIASTAEPKDPSVAYCYPDTNPERGDNWLGNTIQAVPDANGVKPTFSALATCAEMWDLGVVRPAGVTPTRDTGNPVPELTACVDKEGAVVIFPADSSICERLGFPALR